MIKKLAHAIKKTNPFLLFCLYYGITIVNCVSFYLTSFWSAESVSILGNQSIILPMFGLLMVGETGSIFIGRIILCYWVVSIVLLLICFIVTIWNKKFAFFFILVLIDAVFTIVFTIVNMLQGHVTVLHFLMFLGAFFDFVLANCINTASKKCF